MSDIFAGMPFLRRTEGVIPARTWNLWRRWRRHFGPRLEHALSCRSGTAFLATDDYWVMIDMAQQGAPLILWLEFANTSRTALHEDLPCMVQFYDYPGARFHDAVLEEVTVRMQQDLDKG